MRLNRLLMAVPVYLLGSLVMGAPLLAQAVYDPRLTFAPLRSCLIHARRRRARPRIRRAPRWERV